MTEFEKTIDAILERDRKREATVEVFVFRGIKLLRLYNLIRLLLKLSLNLFGCSCVIAYPTPSPFDEWQCPHEAGYIRLSQSALNIVIRPCMSSIRVQ